MAPPAVDAAVQSALANQQYDRVAAILDAAELEVGCFLHLGTATSTLHHQPAQPTPCPHTHAVEQPRRAGAVAARPSHPWTDLQPAAVSRGNADSDSSGRQQAHRVWRSSSSCGMWTRCRHPELAMLCSVIVERYDAYGCSLPVGLMALTHCCTAGRTPAFCGSESQLRPSG